MLLDAFDTPLEIEPQVNFLSHFIIPLWGRHGCGGQENYDHSSLTLAQVQPL